MNKVLEETIALVTKDDSVEFIECWRELYERKEAEKAELLREVEG